MTKLQSAIGEADPTAKKNSSARGFQEWIRRSEGLGESVMLQLAELMVGVTGFEPTTPASRKRMVVLKRLIIN
jgi:hypothetical protein